MFSNFFIFLLFYFIVVFLDLLIAPAKDKVHLYEVVIRNANLLFVFSGILLLLYDPYAFPFQFEYIFNFFFLHNFYLHFSVDGVSLTMVLLSIFLLPFCILVSWQSILYRRKAFYLLLFLVIFLLLFVFTVMDLFYFYLGFEIILIPMFILIGVLGFA